MPDPLPPFFLDEDVSVVVGSILRARGFDVVTARDAQRLGCSDVEQLLFSAHRQRVLLTHNRVDFERLHQTWLENNQTHSGILIARRRFPGELADRVGRLLARLGSLKIHNQIFYV